MEIGKWTVYFVQYQGTMGRWFTKNLSHGEILDALEAARDHELNYNEKTRIVEQTTVNRVV